MSQIEDNYDFLDANQEDSDYDGGDTETFTFSGGAIDIDEIFGGIDTDLILDGGGSVEIHEYIDGNGRHIKTVIPIKEGVRPEHLKDGKEQNYDKYIDGEKVSSIVTKTDVETKKSDIIGAAPDDEDKRPSIITTTDKDEDENENEDEDKKPSIITTTDKDEDDKRSFNGGDDDDVVHGGGSHTTVCSKIVELLPNLFTPVHDL